MNRVFKDLIHSCTSVQFLCKTNQNSQKLRRNLICVTSRKLSLRMRSAKMTNCAKECCSIYKSQSLSLRYLSKCFPTHLLGHHPGLGNESVTVALNNFLLHTKQPFSKIVKMALAIISSATGFYFTTDRLLLPGTVMALSSARTNFIADVVQKAGPAVVFIEIKGRHPISGKRITLANGSGFLVRSNGLILTNAHVVANKPKVSVKLYDGSTYEGTVTAVDPVCDLATVKIETGSKLPIIPLGKSSSIRPGEFVAAMGSPLSLHKTVTIGIVSSHLRGSRDLGMNNKNMEYIQTDATIGLGNSGGPLVNLEGQAIGINTLKLTEGISFAIPADYAGELLAKADLLASKADVMKKPSYLPNGKETNKRRYMGITMLPLTPPLIMELKDKIRDFPEIATGVYIHKVVVSSPAYAGGLHAGDIIVDINGAKIETPADVYKMVEKSERLRISVIRGRHMERFSVVTETL